MKFTANVKLHKSNCRCFGQMVMPESWFADKLRIPALAMMSSASVTSPHFDKWQLAKWAEISRLHSKSKTWLSLSLLDPHGVCRISWKEQLSETADFSRSEDIHFVLRIEQNSYKDWLR